MWRINESHNKVTHINLQEITQSNHKSHKIVLIKLTFYMQKFFVQHGFLITPLCSFKGQTLKASLFAPKYHFSDIAIYLLGIFVPGNRNSWSFFNQSLRIWPIKKFTIYQNNQMLDSFKNQRTFGPGDKVCGA